MSRPVNIVDLFCGGGGTSTGAIRAAERRGLRVELCAVNHWQIAIETHARNHPTAKHLCKAIDQVRPREAVRGQVDLLLASPECTHHSVARGGMPINDQSRMSAWEVIRWASELLPRRIIVENVKEFQTWGPIGSEGRPLKSRKGETFAAWCQAIRSLGYRIDMRVLNAANFGGATTRERLFVQAVRGRAEILWPAPSHAKLGGAATLFDSGMRPWKPAREIIDWSLPSQSIFSRKKPLAAATLARIEAGLRKFGGRAAEPFIVALRNHVAPRSVADPVPTVTAGGQHLGLCQPFVIGQQSCSAPRSVDSPVPTIATAGAVSLVEPFIVSAGGPTGQGRNPVTVDGPLPTIVTENHKALVQPFIVPMNRAQDAPRAVNTPLNTITATSADMALCEPYIIPLNHGGRDFRSHSMGDLMPTITTIDAWGMVEPLLVEYNGEGDAHPVSDPAPTITTRDRFGLAQFAAGAYLDIHFRMLQPHELAAAMGFPADYYFHGNREQKVKQIGNAVHVDQAEALCFAAMEGAS